MNNFFRIWFWVWGLCFTFFASLQFNDPDPMIWVTWYLIAAGISIVFTFWKLPLWFFLIYTAINLIWAYFQWPEKFEGFEQQVPHNLNIEKARETGGLLLIAVFSLFCTLIAGSKTKLRR